jgi:hypothetical protein
MVYMNILEIKSFVHMFEIYSVLIGFIWSCSLTLVGINHLRRLLPEVHEEMVHCDRRWHQYIKYAVFSSCIFTFYLSLKNRSLYLVEYIRNGIEETGWDQRKKNILIEHNIEKYSDVTADDFAICLNNPRSLTFRQKFFLKRIDGHFRNPEKVLLAPNPLSNRQAFCYQLLLMTGPFFIFLGFVTSVYLKFDPELKLLLTLLEGLSLFAI